MGKMLPVTESLTTPVRVSFPGGRERDLSHSHEKRLIFFGEGRADMKAARSERVVDVT